MKTIRVFVSSTGDVQKERHLAERVMRSIAAEFNLPVSASCSNFQRLAEENGAPENGAPKTEPDNQSPLVLCPYFLEYQKLATGGGLPGTIPNTAEFDLVICILWSRLGTLLAPTLRMPDGSRPPRERNTKLAGRWTTQARTEVFRRCTFIATVRSRRRRWNRKRSAKPLAGNGTPVQEFFAHWEKNSEGNFVGTLQQLSQPAGV